jgi:hypothetical protein
MALVGAGQAELRPGAAERLDDQRRGLDDQGEEPSLQTGSGQQTKSAESEVCCSKR